MRRGAPLRSTPPRKLRAAQHLPTHPSDSPPDDHPSSPGQLSPPRARSATPTHQGKAAATGTTAAAQTAPAPAPPLLGAQWQWRQSVELLAAVGTGDAAVDDDDVRLASNLVRKLQAEQATAASATHEAAAARQQSETLLEALRQLEGEAAYDASARETERLAQQERIRQLETAVACARREASEAKTKYERQGRIRDEILRLQQNESTQKLEAQIGSLQGELAQSRAALVQMARQLDTAHADRDKYIRAISQQENDQGVLQRETLMLREEIHRRQSTWERMK
eukprot:COSAG01_NODE_5679_length_4104_cov_13.740574_2_plen_282_part_00